MAPKVVSVKGRIVILIVWAILIIIAITGLVRVETNFSMEFFIPRGSPIESYLLLDIKYF